MVARFPLTKSSPSQAIDDRPVAELSFQEHLGSLSRGAVCPDSCDLGMHGSARRPYQSQLICCDGAVLGLHPGIDHGGRILNGKIHDQSDG